MKFDDELNELAAEKVLGYELCSDWQGKPMYADKWRERPGNRLVYRHDGLGYHPVENFTTDFNAAFLLVQKLRIGDWQFVTSAEHDKWSVHVYLTKLKRSGHAHDENLARAITIAALRVKGVDV